MDSDVDKIIKLVGMEQLLKSFVTLHVIVIDRATGQNIVNNTWPEVKKKEMGGQRVYLIYCTCTSRWWVDLQGTFWFDVNIFFCWWHERTCASSEILSGSTLYKTCGLFRQHEIVPLKFKFVHFFSSALTWTSSSCSSCKKAVSIVAMFSWEATDSCNK